jgi:hypothetical protein
LIFISIVVVVGWAYAKPIMVMIAIMVMNAIMVTIVGNHCNHCCWFALAYLLPLSW